MATLENPCVRGCPEVYHVADARKEFHFVVLRAKEEMLFLHCGISTNFEYGVAFRIKGKEPSLIDIEAGDLQFGVAKLKLLI